jgi:hypothetical protein
VPAGSSSTIAGEFGSTVSRYCFSEMSSMRAPFSEIEPVIAGVSILTRGVAASAASRLCVVVAGCAGVTVFGAAGALALFAAGGALPPPLPAGVVALLCAGGLTTWVCAACSCFFSVGTT